MQRGHWCSLMLNEDSWHWLWDARGAGQGGGFWFQKRAKQQGRLGRREVMLWNGFAWRQLHIWIGAVRENEIQTRCCSLERSCYGAIALLSAGSTSVPQVWLTSARRKPTRSGMIPPFLLAFPAFLQALIYLLSLAYCFHHLSISHWTLLLLALHPTLTFFSAPSPCPLFHSQSFLVPSISIQLNSNIYTVSQHVCTYLWHTIQESVCVYACTS